MVRTPPPNASYFKFALTGSSEPEGTPIPLTDKDIDAFPNLPDKIHALAKQLPAGFALARFLVDAELRVYLVPELPGDEGAIRAQKTCDEIVNVLEFAVDKLRENAQQFEPRSFKKLGIAKPLESLVKAFVIAEDEPSSPPELVHFDGRKRAMPMLDAAMVPAVVAPSPSFMRITEKIKGLIRGGSGEPHQLILEGGTHVQLPKQSTWEWKAIHLILEEPHLLSGTLIRLPNSNKWTVDTDTKVASQSEMDLAPVGV